MSSPPSDTSRFAGVHLRFGWCVLTLFMVLGIVLETLHGLKLRWYVDAGVETRRLMLTLAHAHGVLLALVNILFAVTLRTFAAPRVARLKLISAALRASTILLPGGFLLGGLVVYGGDPGVGVVLVPAGALLLVGAGILLSVERYASNDER